MNKLSFLVASSVATAVLVVACGGSDDSAGTTATSGSSGSSGTSSAGAAGKAGAGGSTAGAGGSTAGAGGSTAGAGGSTAGAGGTTAGAGGSTAGAGGSTAGAGGSALSCDAYNPAQMVSPTSVRLINMTASPLYLGQANPDCQFHLGFDVEDGSGKTLKTVTTACEFTCGNQQSNGCSCPPVACNPPIVTLVAPGGSYDVPWTGTVFANADMPANCYSDKSCVTHGCFMESLAPKPSTLKASAWSEAQGCAGGPCPPCTPGASGNCSVAGASKVGGTENKGVVTWNGESKLTIEFK